MQHNIENNRLKVAIRLDGAEVCSVKNTSGMEYMWQADPEVWPRHAPVLFPVVGKLKDNKYSWHDNEYHLPQHGFARDMVFTPVNIGQDHCSFILSSDEDTLKKYPFNFLLTIHYKLVGNRLDTAYEITNRGELDMLFSIGAHPGFNIPLVPGEQPEDHYLEFDKDELKASVLQDGLLSGNYRFISLTDNKLPLSRELFQNDAIVLENHQVNTIRLVSAKSGPLIDLQCEGWPYFGIWSKKGCDRFVCLEPWYGIADKANAQGPLNEKKGILILKPSGTFRCAFSLHFH